MRICVKNVCQEMGTIYNDLVQHSMYVIVQLNTSLGRYIKAWMMYGDIQ